MCQREGKGGEQMMRKQEMKHKVTEKSAHSGKKEAGREKNVLQIGKASVYNMGGIF